MARDDRAPSRLILTGGKVIDGLGQVHENWNVLIEGDRISGVGHGIPVPRDATEINVSGKTVMPGLFDMHGHMYARGAAAIAMQIPAYPLLYLAGGVTTVRAPGELVPEAVVELREAQASGSAVGPRVFTAGPYFDHNPSSVSWIKGTDDAKQALAMFECWRDRLDMVKVYSRIREDQFIAIERAAHAAGLPVMGHLGSLTAKRAIELGIDGLEHGLFTMSEFRPVDRGFEVIENLDLDSPEVTKLIHLIVKKKVTICPTIVTFQYYMDHTFQPPAPNWLGYLNPEARANQEERLLKSEPLHRERAVVGLRAMNKQLEFTGMVHKAGGLVVPGTDPVGPAITPGWGIHVEIQNLVRSGLTALEAIRAATYDSARALGVDQETGSIAVGKLADLVIVEGDPSRDVADTSRTQKVILGGVVFDPSMLRKQALGQIA